MPDSYSESVLRVGVSTRRKSVLLRSASYGGPPDLAKAARHAVTLRELELMPEDEFRARHAAITAVLSDGDPDFAPTLDEWAVTDL